MIYDDDWLRAVRKPSICFIVFDLEREHRCNQSESDSGSRIVKT